jgi:hypothetical protein
MHVKPDDSLVYISSQSGHVNRFVFSDDIPSVGTSESAQREIRGSENRHE